MNDAVATAVWMPANGLLLSAAWLGARRLFPRDGVGTITLHVLVLWWACVVVATLVLGAVGILAPVLLLASVCATCVVVLVVLWATGKWQGGSAVIRGVDSEGAVGAGKGPPEGGTTNRGTKMGTDTERSGRSEPPYSPWWTVVWGLLGSLFVARLVFDGLLTFPSDWDTLAYHVPLVDHWIREGSLYVPNCAFWYSPGNNEIVGLWLVAPFSGDFLIALNNLPAVLLTAIAAIELVASFGVSRHLCHLAGMAIMATEVTWRQMVSAENDLAVTGLFLATLLYGIRYARRGKRADLVFAAIAFGLLTGVKYYALGYAGVAGLGVISLVAASRGPRACARAAAIGLAGAIVLGGYWYARNAWVTGTPLYPKGLTQSTDVWARIRPDSPSSTLMGSGRVEVWPLLAEAVANRAGPCHLVATFALPVVIPWLAGSAVWRRVRRRRVGWLSRAVQSKTLVSSIVQTGQGPHPPLAEAEDGVGTKDGAAEAEGTLTPALG